MEHFIAYHSVRRMGYRLKATSTSLGFLSKKIGLLKKAIGNKVWLVQGEPDGKKTTYTLWGAFIPDSITSESPSSDVYLIDGPQVVEFDPPLILNQLDWFPMLLKSQR